MKGSLQFEGLDSGTNYKSGFGVIADPYISVTSLEGKCLVWAHTCDGKCTRRNIMVFLYVHGYFDHVYFIGSDSWIIVHTDGMNDTTSRGGGGGIDNNELASICKSHGKHSANISLQFTDKHRVD